jgi:pyrroloquinoline-quinone synthase
MSCQTNSQTVERLNEMIAEKHLLKHPFYQAWSAGRLSVADLQHYSQQYFAHVRAFPAYLSEMHSRCGDLNQRRVIAANLADEEAGRPSHPELWLDFAEGLGVSRESVLNAEPGPRMKALVETYKSLARRGTPTAAAALYCYEKQIPEVAAAKIDGLQKHYGIASEDTLRYFRVHETADVKHSAEWAELLSSTGGDATQVGETADLALSALWAALDEIYEGCSSARPC